MIAKRLERYHANRIGFEEVERIDHAIDQQGVLRDGSCSL